MTDNEVQDDKKNLDNDKRSSKEWPFGPACQAWLASQIAIEETDLP